MPDYDLIKKASGGYKLQERTPAGSNIMGIILIGLIISLLMLIAGPIWLPIQIAFDFLSHDTPQTLLHGFMLLFVNFVYSSILSPIIAAYAIKAKSALELKEYNRSLGRFRVFVRWLLIFCALWLLELIPFIISIYLQSQSQSVLH